MTLVPTTELLVVDANCSYLHPVVLFVVVVIVVVVVVVMIIVRRLPACCWHGICICIK